MTTGDTTDTFPSDPASAQADVAFMRTVLDERGSFWRTGGFLYAAAGLLYGGDALIGWLGLAGPFDLPPATQFYAAIISNGGFLAALVYVLVKQSRRPPLRGVASRAVNLAFTGVGLANVATGIVFAIAAFRAGDLMVWLIFPVIVMALQGAAWFAVGGIMRVGWMRLVSAGWFLAAIVTGYLLTSLTSFLLAAGVSLLVLMVGPGLAMMRMGKESA